MPLGGMSPHADAGLFAEALFTRGSRLGVRPRWSVEGVDADPSQGGEVHVGEESGVEFAAGVGVRAAQFLAGPERCPYRQAQDPVASPARSSLCLHGASTTNRWPLAASSAARPSTPKRASPQRRWPTKTVRAESPGLPSPPSRRRRHRHRRKTPSLRAYRPLPTSFSSIPLLWAGSAGWGSGRRHSHRTHTPSAPVGRKVAEVGEARGASWWGCGDLRNVCGVAGCALYCWL